MSLNVELHFILDTYVHVVEKLIMNKTKYNVIFSEGNSRGFKGHDPKKHRGFFENVCISQ